LLSIAGRVQLVKAVVQSMLTYSITLYSWPVSLLKDLEKCIKNFIWSGDLDKRKLVTVSWKKVCRPVAQGGLNLRSLITLNKASNLKLCWSMINSHSAWAILLKDSVFKKGRVIKHHIYSSIWSGIKDELEVICDNSVWLVGDGSNINFWLDSWCGDPLVDQLHIPAQFRNLLSAKVSDFIVNGQWSIPTQLSSMFSSLSSIISTVSIPMESTQDTFIWKHTDNGDLELKQAYDFKLAQVQELHWARLIWNADIPPSKSLLAWRLMHDKLPTYDNLMTEGCSIPSMCNFCLKHTETSFHIFFECQFAIKLWSWLAGCLNFTLQFTSMEDMWKLCDLNWSPQSKVTILAAIINLLYTIWIFRNKARFHDIPVNWRSAVSMISINTAMTGNNTRKLSSNSIRDFTILKRFNITIHQPKTNFLKEVFWHPPLVDWIKCNIDGASSGNPGKAACGGIFRNHESEFVYGFAELLGNITAYIAEMSGAIRAIEIAFHNQWTNLWLESDSSSVVAAFHNPTKPVAWCLRNRWKNALYMTTQMNFMVSHIYREGNQVADLLANHGLSILSIVYWNNLPLFVRDSFTFNKNGSTSFRLCNS
jgi:ribonuclease HI